MEIFRFGLALSSLVYFAVGKVCYTATCLGLKFPFIHSAPQSCFSKQCSSSCCNLSALWYLEAAAHLTDKVLLFLAFALLFDPVLSSGRQQWFPQPVGSSGCLVESLHLPVGNSFTITRISGSCIWPPRPGSRSSKWCVLKSVTITSWGTVSAWSELRSWCGAVISQLSAHLSLGYEDAHVELVERTAFRKKRKQEMCPRPLRSKLFCIMHGY